MLPRPRKQPSDAILILRDEGKDFMEILAWQDSLAAARLQLWATRILVQTFSMMTIMQFVSCTAGFCQLLMAMATARLLSTNLLIWGTTDQLTTATNI